MKDLLHLNEEFLKSLGIVDWGYTEESLPHSLGQYQQWIEEGLHGPLEYLSDHRKDLRGDLKHVYPEFQSALVFLFSYQEAKKWLIENNHHEIAGYALGFGGEDYHYFLKSHLEILFSSLKEAHPGLERFIALDAQPIMERDLAYRAGLGWFGKNSMLINRKEGSYFIIGSLLLNQKFTLMSSALDIDHCGQCQACVEACPTQVIDPTKRTIDAKNCLSTYTIETFKEVPPPEGMEKSRGEIFGCDICQDVCPWNRKPLMRVISKLDFQERFSFLKEWLFNLSRKDLMKMLEGETNRGFRKRLYGTAFDRPGRVGWLKNLKAYFTNRNDL